MKHNYKCQNYGYSFHMDNGKEYCEAHHLKMLSRGGTQDVDNVIILCENHHRMFHYASDKIRIDDAVNGKRVVSIFNDNYIVDL